MKISFLLTFIEINVVILYATANEKFMIVNQLLNKLLGFVFFILFNLFFILPLILFSGLGWGQGNDCASATPISGLYCSGYTVPNAHSFSGVDPVCVGNVL